MIRGHVGRGSYVQPRAEARRWDAAPSTTAPPAIGTISFNTSRPAEDLFPIEDFRVAAGEFLASQDLPAVLQLGSPAGFEPLRAHLMESLRSGQVAKPGDDLLITNGCQQALDLLQRTFVEPGDRVAIEDPVYPGVREVFQRAGAAVSGYAGLDELESLCRRERAKIVVVTPNFQNPTGQTLTLAERHAILRLAGVYGFIVVENDIYSPLRYQGAALPSLKQLDGAGDVIQLGSFSKISFPGLRVGWMVGPKPALARCIDVKQWMDLHTDQLSQAILLRFAQSGRLEVHRRRVIEAGAERLGVAVKACDEHLGPRIEFTRPEGGMNLWVTLPEGMDAAQLAPRATQLGVSYLAGRYFSVTRPHASSLRLSFAGLPPAQIESGIRLLGGLFRREMEQARVAPPLSATAMV